MCVRGLLMIMHNHRLAEYAWMGVTYELAKALNQVFKDCRPDSQLIQYLDSFTKVQMVQYVMKVQSMITMQIVTEDVNLDHLEETVKVLDLLYRVDREKSADL